MSTKKILREIDADEIVKSYVLPVQLTRKQEEESRKQLSEARRKLRAQTKPEEILTGRLMQLKFQLEEYINSGEYQPKRFGYFLRSYLHILNKKSNEFAEEISIHKTMVSQLINNTREPNESLIIRLELHSNNNIPADYWLRIILKDKIHNLAKNKELRRREKKYVLRKLKSKC